MLPLKTPHPYPGNKRKLSQDRTFSHTANPSNLMVFVKIQEANNFAIFRTDVSSSSGCFITMN